MDANAGKAVSSLMLILSFAAISVVYVVGKAVYDVYYGPLSHIPGPKINAFTAIPYVRHLVAGTPAQNTVNLHRKYGSVVRLSPTEVSFTSATTAYPDIYGFRTGKMKGHVNMPKDVKWYGPPTTGTPSIILANDEDHTRVRKVLSHAFSERSLAAQEELLQDYVGQLVNRLRETVAKDPKPVNMVKWYNWTTFDVIADLLFGEPFGCLAHQTTHEHVDLLLDMLTINTQVTVFGYLPWLKPLRRFLLDKNLLSRKVQFVTWVKAQVQKRMQHEPSRADFMTDILANNGRGAKLLDPEIISNSNTILVAGSETTATLLSGATYLLLQNSQVLARLQSELRSSFAASEDITLDAVARLPYLQAVLQESLRVYPPVPVGFVRSVGKGGEIVSGHYIPEGTAVSVSQYASNHDPENFCDPDEFVPERWLDDADSRYANDQRSGVQPFNIGPRACIGRNLAYAEMRLILANIIWHFDLALQPESKNWIERSTVMRVWVKPPLMVKVTEASRQGF